MSRRATKSGDTGHVPVNLLRRLNDVSVAGNMHRLRCRTTATDKARLLFLSYDVAKELRSAASRGSGSAGGQAIGRVQVGRVFSWRWRARALRCGAAVTSIIVAATMLAACGNLSGIGQDEARPPDVFDRVRSLDLLPRNPRPVEGSPSIADDRRAVEYETTSASATTTRVQPGPTAQRTANGGEGYELNFENTPLTTVAKVVLGDMLGIGYTIDPRVQGNVSLASGRPVPKSDILYVLEDALRVSNAGLVRNATGDRKSVV